ncbi:hypothetical protein N431DRAFT_486551 [Stipitochalara longipes BDJ]|nr:hypothetical protein N431DRAFT_486551 [Stipitochalara longipes BDJ]
MPDVQSKIVALRRLRPAEQYHDLVVHTLLASGLRYFELTDLTMLNVLTILTPERNLTSVSIPFIIVLLAFLPLATALDISTVVNLTHRAISAPLLPRDTTPNPFSSHLVLRGEGSLGKQFTEILEDWVAGKITTPGLSETIAAEIYSAICSHFAGAAITAGAFPEVAAMLEYLSLVFDTIALPTGPEGWLIAFTFAVMVNIRVNELFPMISAMADQACEAAKESVLCSTHFEDDALNCGYCGNQCPSGKCSNSACVSNTCTGETCETFTACGSGGTCVCASTVEGTGFCVDGTTPCAGLQTCGTSSDCPAGVVCAVASCCGINVCVGATTCGVANVTLAAKFLFMKHFDGLSFGHLD